jgi:magnesium transporter
MGIVGWLTYLALRQAERREVHRKLEQASAALKRPG